MSAKLSIDKFFPTTVSIDGQEIRVRIARMTATEFFRFSRDFERAGDPLSTRQVLVRKDGDELEKRPVPRARTGQEEAAAAALAALRQRLGEIDLETEGYLQALEALVPPEPVSEVFVVSDEDVIKRRLTEMTPEQRAAWRALDDEDEAFAAQFIVDTITHYVEVEAGEIELHGEPLSSGAQLVTYFGGHASALRGLVQAVRRENALPESVKNALRSARASKSSSGTPTLTVDGEAPVAAVAPVAPPASAPVAAATA